MWQFFSWDPSMSPWASHLSFVGLSFLIRKRKTWFASCWRSLGLHGSVIHCPCILSLLFPQPSGLFLLMFKALLGCSLQLSHTTLILNYILAKTFPAKSYEKEELGKRNLINGVSSCFENGNFELILKHKAKTSAICFFHVCIAFIYSSSQIFIYIKFLLSWKLYWCQAHAYILAYLNTKLVIIGT